MTNTINPVIGQGGAIKKVGAKSSEDYSKEAGALQDDINNVYDKMLLEDRDERAILNELNEESEGFINFVDDWQAGSKENAQGMIDASKQIYGIYKQAWKNYAMAADPVTAQALDIVFAAMDAAIPLLTKIVEKFQENKNEMIDNFQKGILDGNKEKAKEEITNTKNNLKADTEANGGKVVSGSGVQIKLDGSDNQDLYVEGSGNTIMIDGDYAGNIVFAPDSTDNKIIIKGSYEDPANLSMGGMSNELQIEGDLNAKSIIIGGDDNKVSVDGDVNNDIKFGGEGNIVEHGGELNGDIPVNTSATNKAVKKQIPPKVPNTPPVNNNTDLEAELNKLLAEQQEANKNKAAAENEEAKVIA